MILRQAVELVKRVKLPAGAMDGRTLAVLLHSLAHQIGSDDLNRRVKALRIDKEARELQVHFEEEAS